MRALFIQTQTADELFRNIREAAALHFENGAGIPEIDILVASELKLPHAPGCRSLAAATSFAFIGESRARN
jgi:hypothetical protein